MSDKKEDYFFRTLILGLGVGIVVPLFFIFGVLEHGSRCQPYNLRSPSQQLRDTEQRHTLLDKDVQMLRLKIQKQELEKQLEPRIF